MTRPGPSECLLGSANGASTTAIGNGGKYVNYASLDNQHFDDSGSSNWTDIRPDSPASSDQLDELDDACPASVDKPISMPIITMVCILSTAFSYGCTLTTLFLITLPMECERIHQSHPGTPKSVALGTFVAVAGLTQLVSPLVGRLSDIYAPPPRVELGRRLPYLVLGSFGAVAGLLGQMFASEAGNVWLRYGVFFLLNMMGLTTMYSMMLALIPDQVPDHQTGVANGVLALLLTTGSLFGFGVMQLYYNYYYADQAKSAAALAEMKAANLSSVYALYICVVIVSTILTGTYGHDRDAELAMGRMGKGRYDKGDMENSQNRSSDEVFAQVSTLLTGFYGQDTAADIIVTQTDHGMAVSQVDDDDLGGIHPERNYSASGRHLRADFQKEHRHSRRRRWRSAVKRTTKKATQAVIVTPTMILKSMLVDPFHSMDWSIIYQSYVIDRVKYHDFYFVTLSRLFYYCGMSVQTFFLYFLKDVIRPMHHVGPETAVASLAILGQCAAAFTCYPVGVISDKVLGGQRKPFVYLACAVLSLATATIISARTLLEMMHLCLIIGAANGVYLTMDTSLAVDTLPKESELDQDETSGSAQLLGVWGVAAFLGTTLGPLIGGPLLYIFGRQPAPCDPDDAECISSFNSSTMEESYTIRGYAVVLGLSAVYYLLSAGTLCFVQSAHE